MWNWHQMIGGNFQPLDVILPVGISFYTFQSISYIVDVYKERVAPTKTWLEYLFFLSSLGTLLPGARELLEYLVKKYDVNILSNGFQEVQRRKLKSSKIEEYIHHLVLSDDCGITKPLKGIFDYALQRTGAMADTTVMIGDNYDADVKGAKNAGWRTILFNIKGFDRNNVPDADIVVDSLDEIKEIL